MAEQQVVWISLGVALLIMIAGVVASVVVSRKDRERNRVLSVVAGQSGATAQKAEKQRDAQKRAAISKKLQEASNTRQKSGKITLTQRIGQAGLTISVKRFWLNSLIFGFLFSLALAMLNINPVAQVLLGFTGFLGIPRFYLKVKAQRRQRKFLEEFSDALEAMIRLLQAGMPVSEAISMVAREFTGPVSEEMARIYEDQKVGIPLPEAAARSAQRMPITEMFMFATAIEIQSETGSSLSEVLGNLAAVIRARFRLKRKVKALSSEAKASAGIIGSLPVLVCLGLYAVNPDYISVLFEVPKGKMMLTGTVVWMSLGILVMKGMINFKV